MKEKGFLLSFSNVKRLGSGTYGDVYSGEEKDTGKKVAIKRMREPAGGGEGGVGVDEEAHLKKACVTEIKILKHLAGHDNILSIQRSQDDFIVLELMQHDLRGLLNSKEHLFFSHAQVKGYLHQALKGVSWIHARGVIHRDLKPDNILVSFGNVVKIADFGMACYFDPNKSMNTVVCASWYRAPELFLGCSRYGYEIDVWSMGCIIGEMVADTPLFNRYNEEEQVDAIWRLLGTPCENGWPEASKTKGWEKHKPKEAIQRNLLNAFQSFNKTSRKMWFTKELLSLLDQMLSFNPKSRIASTKALTHPYWLEEYPNPHTPSLLPKYKDSYLGGMTKKA
jgi:cyclin-dependent kinase 12/13